MEAPETAGAAAQRDAGGDPSKSDVLAGAVDNLKHNPAGADEQADVDLSALGIGLNECESELLQCIPIVCHPDTCNRLYALGISGPGVTGRRLFDELCVDQVEFLTGARFEFCRLFNGDGCRRVAVIIPVRDEFGDLADLAAWHIESGELSLWRGRASILGAENVYAPRLAEPLKVYETAAGWLRTGRKGVVVLDGQRAAPLLHLAAPLGVRSEAFGRRLRDALSIPAPRIVVAAPVRAAA